MNIRQGHQTRKLDKNQTINQTMKLDKKIRQGHYTRKLDKEIVQENQTRT